VCGCEENMLWSLELLDLLSNCDDHLMVNDYPAIVMVKKNCYGQFDESFFLIIDCNWMNGRKKLLRK
jgi:hypothetical protein